MYSYTVSSNIVDVSGMDIDTKNISNAGICMYVCVYVCVCMYVCTHVCTHVCMYGVYSYTHTQRIQAPHI